MAMRTGTEDRGAGRRGSYKYLEDVKEIVYTDVELLKKFLTDHGRIMPARLTGVSAKQQRELKRAVRQARNMGLLP